MSLALPHLFSTMRLGTRLLRNRIGFASLSTRFAANGRVTDRLIRHVSARAAGGAGLIVTEAMCASRTAQEPVRVFAFDEGSLEGLTRLGDAVSAHGVPLIGQLWHGGSAKLTGRALDAVGVSPVADGMSWTVPRAMTGAEIEALIAEYAESSARLQRAGFAGAEVSAAHGFLPLQFLSPRTNRRQDEWGGDVIGRTRFIRSIIRAIRAACGAHFIVGLKLPADDFVPGSIPIDESESITRTIVADQPPDYLCYSQGNHGWSLRHHAPDMHDGPAPFRALTARLRLAAGGIPVAAIGRYGDPDIAEAALADGACDLVMMARPMLADPELPRKAAAGEHAAIRPCIACNACWGEIIGGRPVGCSVNGRAGRADELAKPPIVGASAHVVVVGAGVAGLEAARIAAARGHHVTLLGASDTTGGKAALHACLPGCADIAGVIAWQTREVQNAGVAIRSGAVVNADAVLALSPDRVILATGARLAPPEGLRCDEAPQDARQVAAATVSREGRLGGTIVMFDHDHTAMTYALAELLASRSDRVILLTPRETVARDLPLVYAQGVHARLAKAKVTITPYARPVHFGNGRLVWRHELTGEEAEIAGIDLFTYATPRIPNDELAGSLRAAGLAPMLVGDARMPRAMLSAMAEGHAAGEIV